MEKYRLAKLNDQGGDLSRQWYIYYSFQHPETRQMQRFKKAVSMRLLTKVARYSESQRIIKGINKWLREGNNPFSDSNGNKNLCDALDEYVVSISHKHRKRSLHTYRCFSMKLKTYLKKIDKENMKVSEFTVEVAKKYLDCMINDHHLANRTYNNIKEASSTIFRYLVDKKYTDINPFRGIPKLQEEEAEITCLTPTELQLMKNKLPGENFPLYAISMMVFYCFLRPQEIVRLKAENIDLVHQRIRMGGQITKNKKTQVIVIPDPLLEVLVKLKNLNTQSDNYIFSTNLKPGTTEIAPTRIAEAWRKWADVHDVHKTIYHLKHTGVGMAIEAGINARDLQLQLRHGSLDETQKYLEKFNNVASDRLKSSFPRF